MNALWLKDWTVLAMQKAGKDQLPVVHFGSAGRPGGKDRSEGTDRGGSESGIRQDHVSGGRGRQPTVAGVSVCAGARARGGPG